jgi:hypothetical protein
MRMMTGLHIPTVCGPPVTMYRVIDNDHHVSYVSIHLGSAVRTEMDERYLD